MQNVTSRGLEHGIAALVPVSRYVNNNVDGATELGPLERIALKRQCEKPISLQIMCFY